MPEPAALAGVRVVDLTALLPGPYCTRILADLGAEVIKVERPPDGDLTRVIAPELFEAVNRGKRSVTLDLRRDEDRARLDALLRAADVVIEGFRPGVAARLGAGYDHVRVLNPDVIYCSLSGYGQSGPARDLSGHDLNYLGVVGALDPADSPGQPPRHYATIPMADLSGALFAATAILAALVRRAALPPGSRGAYLDASLAGAALALTSGRLGEVGADATTTSPPLLRGGAYHAYLGSDGRAFTVGCVEDIFFQRLCLVLDRPDLAADPAWATFPRRSACAGELDALLAAEFSKQPRDEWIARLRAADVPVGPVNAPHEVPSDPYVAASGLLLCDPVAEGRVRGVRYPVLMPGLAVPPGAPDTRRAPALGEHNAIIFGQTDTTDQSEQERQP